MKMIKVAAKSLFILLMFVSAYPNLAQSTGADFELAVAEYQQSHSTAAVEKVIKLAAAMGRLPAIPEEARRHFVRGTALFRDANSPEDFTQVLDEFKQATDLAPWWPEARYNWALAYEAAGDYAKAIDHLNLYLLFKLPEAEARTVQDKIYVLEAKQEKAVKEGQAKVQKLSEEEHLKDAEKALALPQALEGDWYIVDENSGHYRLEVSGDVILTYWVFDKTETWWAANGGDNKIHPAGFEMPKPLYTFHWREQREFFSDSSNEVWRTRVVGLVSENGKTIHVTEDTTPVGRNTDRGRTTTTTWVRR
jgi:tetratricopeptide (TPR) repeat protein